MEDPMQALCAAAKAGDAAAAEELVTGHYQRVYAYLRRLCGTEEDAADLTQRTFCKAWASLGSFQGRSGFSTWLHGIAHFTYLDWRRKRPVGLSQPDEWWAACAEPAPGPFEDASSRDLARRLYGIVETLGEESRQAVHLHYYQGLTLAETAQVMNVSAGTVKNRLREALTVLKRKMAEPGALAAEPAARRTHP